jgi:phytoene/squalene synthetase
VSTWSPTEDRLLGLLAAAAPGPKREGLFALWLVVRVAEGVLPPDAADAKAQRRRVAALRRRLATLTLPPPLRRAITAVYAPLEQVDPETVALALQDLAAATREALGAEPSDAVALAARAAQLASSTR